MSNFCLGGCLHEGRKILVQGRRIILAPCQYSVYMQRVVLVPRAGIFQVLGSSQDLPSTSRIFLAARQEDPSTRKILAPCKLPSLGRSQYQGKKAGRSVANHGNKGQPFRLALPRADYCDSSAERKLLTPVKRAERPKLYVCFCRPPFLIPSQTITRTKISACKPNVNLIRLLGSSFLQVKSPLNRVGV